MIGEVPANHETASEAAAQALRDLVEQAVQPVLDQQARGTRELYFHRETKAQTSISYGEDHIEYILYDKERSGDTGGLQGVPFIPTHAIQILSRNHFNGYAKFQVFFGLKEDGTLVRHYIDNPGRNFLMAPSTTRALDEEESRALVEYASAPQLSYDKREVILRLTPEEEQKINECRAQNAESEATYRADIEAINRSHAQAWAESKDIIIR